MKKILVVNVNWLGDVIFSIPVFKALREAYPHSEICCLAVPRVVDVLQYCPHIDEIIVFDERGSNKSLLDKWRLIRELKARRFECVYILRPSVSRTLMMKLARIPKRVGYATEKSGWMLTKKVRPLTHDVHRSETYWNVVSAGFGIEVNDKTCTLEVPEEAVMLMRERLRLSGVKPNDHLVVLNAGGNWHLKRWPVENWGRLAGALIRQFGVRVLISGGPGDRELAAEVCRLSEADPIMWAGQTDLKDTLALFKCARLMISADTGPLHLAGSVGCPAIGIFGPTRPEITGPRGSGRAVILQNDVGCNKGPCYILSCKNNVCMQSIGVEDVLKAYEEFVC